MEQQPRFNEIFREAPIVPYKRGSFTERCTPQSKTVIKDNTRVWESCRPVTPIFNYTNKTNRGIGKQASQYVYHGHGKSRGQ